MTSPGPALRERLRLMVITDPTPACGRPLAQVVAACLGAGATAIELRDPLATGAALLEQAMEIEPLTRRAGALFLVNDRFDVALAAGADGVHLGPEDLPVEAVRRIVPAGFLIGLSTDRPEEARAAAADGADYLGVGAVFGTRSKPGLADERIGPDRVREVLEAAGLPGVGIGGIGPGNAAEVAATGAGVAVLSAVMKSPTPGRVVREIVASIGSVRSVRSAGS